MLVDGKCPNSHDLRRCKNCGWQLENGRCQKCLVKCDACSAENIDSRCSDCGVGEESEDDAIAFDEMDGLWRCVYCSWEVEADSEIDGNLPLSK